MIHNFEKAMQDCSNDNERCILVVRILSENLKMPSKAIARKSKVDKAIVSRLLNHGQGGSSHTLQRLRGALSQQLAAVHILGTCAYPRQYSDDEVTTLKLELATVDHDGAQAVKTSLPEGVGAVWGTTLDVTDEAICQRGLVDVIRKEGFTTFRALHILMDKDIDSDGRKALAHELEEVAKFLRNGDPVDIQQQPLARRRSPF